MVHRVIHHKAHKVQRETKAHRVSEDRKAGRVVRDGRATLALRVIPATRVIKVLDIKVSRDHLASMDSKVLKVGKALLAK